MIAQRVSAKVYLRTESKPNLPGAIGSFHAWIRNKAIDDVLIDVADYSHVHEGPGVMLIGHHADYSLTLTESRPGFQITKKRPGDDSLEASVTKTVRETFELAAKLGAELGLVFASNELLIEIADRLRYPNDDGTFARVERNLTHALASIGHPNARLVREGDERAPLRIRVSL